MANDYDKKFCLECKHFHFWPGCHGYSEYTPGWESGMKCELGHWELDNYDDNTFSLREYLRMARECKDFEEVKDDSN